MQQAIEQAERLHSQHAEQCVIGALLIDRDAFDRIGRLRPEHFYAEAHRLIFSEVVSMSARGQAIDVLTVAEQIEARGLSERTGGLAYLGDMAAATPSARNVGRYADIVRDKWLERQLFAASDEIRAISTGTGETREKLTKAQAAIMAISEAKDSKRPRHISEVLNDVIDDMGRRRDGETDALATGFDDIDRLMNGGPKPGDLVIIAGRPGMGKTTIAVQAAIHAAANGRPALVLSMEMSDKQLGQRLIAMAGNAPLSAVLNGDLEGENGERISAAVGRLHDLPLTIHEQGGLTLFDVCTLARGEKRKNGLGLLVIDYVQLMAGDGDNRNQQIEQISRGLKALAKELAVPVLLLSQLNRAVEARTNRRPMSSDLRESGSLEQDADAILMIYRDEVYNADSPDAGTAEVNITKNRQGSTGTARLAFRGETTSFANLAYGWKPEQREQPARARKWAMAE